MFIQNPILLTHTQKILCSAIAHMIDITDSEYLLLGNWVLEASGDGLALRQEYIGTVTTGEQTNASIQRLELKLLVSIIKSEILRCSEGTKAIYLDRSNGYNIK
jgi:predicted transcriptional regulator